jgi:hypothetical protein
MEKKTEFKNIYQKLLSIQQKVMGLGKDAKSFGYGYVTGSKALEHIKPLMNELGLILKQEVIGFTNERQDYTTKNGSKSEILTKVDMKFTWIDTETGEKDENFWGANGQNDWEKGFGSALTYGERYFLLKYFHIATDEDDIDNPKRETSEPIPPKAPVQVAEPSTDDKVASMQGRLNPELPSGIAQSILNAKNQAELKTIWEANTDLHKVKKFTDAITQMKADLLKQGDK